LRENEGGIIERTRKKRKEYETGGRWEQRKTKKMEDIQI
jgi:hypothetical protein